MTGPYRVTFEPGAAKAFARLPADARRRIRASLERLAADVAGPERIPGKRVKTLQGVSDSFHRLRIGDYRVIYDVVTDEQVLLVAGVVDRSELERWIRSR